MNTENKLFAKRFKQLRLSRGYTQQQTAKLFNVTRPCICYWESGKRVPDFIRLIEICRFFGVSSDYMLGVSSAAVPNTNCTKAAADTTTSAADSNKSLHEFHEFLMHSQKSGN